MNARVSLLLAGLIIGGLVGYLTRPAATEITLGPLSIEVQGDRPAEGGGPLTSGQWQHIAIFTAVGGLIGLAAGFAAGRRGGV
jgi:hypothetical protein